MWKRWAVLAAVVLLLVVVSVWWLVPRHRINEESFNRIQEGMSMAEVEAILGVPDGVYTDLSTYCYTGLPSLGESHKATVNDHLDFLKNYSIEGRKTWYGSQAFITIDFAPDQKVRAKCFQSAYPNTFFETARRNLGF